MSIPNAKWIAAGKQVILKSDFTDIEDGIFSLIHGPLVDLIVKNNAATPDTKIDISARNAWLLDGSGVPFFVDAPDYTIDATDEGVVNGTRAALGASTWYYFYIISNGTTTGGWCDTSATVPVPPSGYVYSRLVGAIRTDASANFWGFKKVGNITTLVKASGENNRIMASGVAGNTTTPTYVAIAVGSFVPPMAKVIRIIAYGTGGVSYVAPNNTYGNYGEPLEAPPVDLVVDTGYSISVPADIVLESTDIYWASNNANDSVACAGWIE